MLTNSKDIHHYAGISQHAMRWLWEMYYESKETGEVVWTPLDAGQPHLLEPGAISTVFTKFYVDHNKPMAAPQVSEIKEFQLSGCLCLYFFVWPINMSVAVKQPLATLGHGGGKHWWTPCPMTEKLVSPCCHTPGWHIQLFIKLKK